jgi:hypothetical protein
MYNTVYIIYIYTVHAFTAIITYFFTLCSYNYLKKAHKTLTNGPNHRKIKVLVHSLVHCKTIIISTVYRVTLLRYELNLFFISIIFHKITLFVMVKNRRV